MVNMQSLISIGKKVPEFNAKAYFPEEDKIKEMKLPSDAGKWQILTFYPGDFTFVCAMDIEAFMSLKQKFDEYGADIYTVSTDSVYSHKGWAGTSPRVSKSTLPMIGDFTKEITTTYGFLNEESGAARRGVIILDPKGVVQYLSVFNDSLGKDAEHIFNAFMGLKRIQDTSTAEGHICAIPANYKAGNEAVDIDIIKDIGKL